MFFDACYNENKQTGAALFVVKHDRYTRKGIKILRKIFTHVWVLVLLVFSPCVVNAEELASAQDLFADFSVTSATRLAQSPHNLPVSVTVIDRNMIEAMGVTELAEVFRIVAGFRVGRVSGGMYSVVGHGIGDHFSRRLMVLVDGRPIQTPFIKIMDWNAIPVEIDDVDYIEVMRGTSAAVYGANAFDGAINIITYKPFENRGVYARLLNGGPNVTSALFRYGFDAFNGDHSLSITDKRGDGFDDVHDGHHFTKLRYRGSFNPTLQDELDVQLGISQGYLEDFDNGVERPRDTDIDDQYLNWRHRYDDGDDFMLKLYRNYIGYDDEILETKYGRGQPFNYKSHSVRYGMDFQRSFNLQDVRLVAGGGLYRDKIESHTKEDSRNLTKQLFTSLEWQATEKFTVNAGALVEDTRNTKPTISPRLAVNYHLDRNNTFRVSAARSFRVTASRAVGTEVSRDMPERITSFEIGHLLTLPDSGLSIDTKIYHDSCEDIPTIGRDAMNQPVKSIGDFSLEGLDLQLKYTPTIKTLVAVKYSYAKTTSQSIHDRQPDVIYEGYDNVMPGNMFSVLLSQKLPHDWQASLTYSYVGEVEWKGWGDFVDRYERLDARIAKDIRIGTNKVKLELIGHNLTNEYTEFADENIMNRRVLVRISLTDR